MPKTTTDKSKKRVAKVTLLTKAEAMEACLIIRAVAASYPIGEPYSLALRATADKIRRLY